MSAVAQRLATVMAEADGLIKGHRDTPLDADGRTKLTALIEEGEGLKSQIESETRLASLGDWAGTSTGRLPLVSVPGMTYAGATEIERTETRSVLVNEWGEGLLPPAQIKTLRNPEYKAAFWNHLRGKGASEYKTLSEGSDPAGGFLVPEDMLNRIIARAPTPMRIAGQVTRLTTSRDALVIPRVNYSADDLYTTGMRVTWTGEAPASATTARVTDPVYGNVRVSIYTAMMSIPVTRDLLEDANFPLQQWLADKFGETVDLLRDNIILNGTGIGQPAGILLNPGTANQPNVVVSGAGSTLTADGLVGLGFSLPEQYDSNAVMVLNKVNTAQAIAKLKDANNRYLWGQGIHDSGLSVDLRNRTLIGYPVIFSGFMPNIAANAFPIIFGDLRGYYLVDRVGLSIQVLSELYAESNQVVLLGRLRFGGITAEPWRMLVHKVST